MINLLGIRSKAAIPLNAIGKYYFLETLNKINIDHYSEFSLELFNHLNGFISQEILENTIKVANLILYGNQNNKSSQKRMPRVSIDDN